MTKIIALFVAMFISFAATPALADKAQTGFTVVKQGQKTTKFWVVDGLEDVFTTDGDAIAAAARAGMSSFKLHTVTIVTK